MSDAEPTRTFCNEVDMTPSQCNEIVEDKLAHLEPVFKCALVVFQRVEHVLANGGFNWRVALSRARKKALDE